MVRSGVHAVHAAPVLSNNLIATINGRPLMPYQPKPRSLNLLACGPPLCRGVLGPMVGWGRMGLALERLD